MFILRLTLLYLSGFCGGCYVMARKGSTEGRWFFFLAILFGALIMLTGRY